MSRRNSLTDITQHQNIAAPPTAAVSRCAMPVSSHATPLNSPAVLSRIPTPVDNLKYVPEYCEEIVGHLLARERLSGRDASFLDSQTEVTDRMRQILVDWLIDVNLKFKLHPETFYLSVDIIDRYLSRKQCTRAHLQLVGITSVLIAAKHEEIWPPEVKDCVYISANTYQQNEVLTMERDIAATLRFRFTVATPYPILCRLLDASDACETTRHAAMFFLDSAAHDYKLAGYLPSRVACAAMLLARMMARPIDGPSSLQWDDTLIAASHGVGYDEVEPIAMELLNATATLTSTTSRLQAVRRKYLSARFGAISDKALPVFNPQTA